MIEHNLDIMKEADWIIDLGPGGGKKGGEIMFAGTPHDLVARSNSLTAQYLRKDLQGINPEVRGSKVLSHTGTLVALILCGLREKDGIKVCYLGGTLMTCRKAVFLCEWGYGKYYI